MNMLKSTHNHWFRLFPLLLGLVLFGLLQTGHAQSGGSLGYGSRVYGMITSTAPLVTYSISGALGDYVVIAADSWTGTLDIQIELVAPDGLILAHSQQNTPTGAVFGAQVAVFLPQTGVYVLRLSGANASSGDYLLRVLGRTATTAETLIYGQAIDVEIFRDADRQFFAFETENCPTTLIVSQPSANPVTDSPFIVKVRDQRGRTVALLRSDEQRENWVTVAANSGRYEVEVFAAAPAVSGFVRLLVTCVGDNPGCPTDAAGADGSTCAPCPPLEPLIPGDTCPDLHFTAQPHPDTLNSVTVTWDMMPAADGYAVYVTGIPVEGGEVYLTHSTWVAGDPTRFTWVLPATGYTSFNFTLRVLVADAVLCTQEAHVDISSVPPDCPDLELTAALTDPAVRALGLDWSAGLAADQFALDLYSIQAGSETYSGRILIPGGSPAYAFDHLPLTLDAIRFVLWMTRAGQLCADELTVTFTQPPDQQFVGTCAIRADREGVAARVGPGLTRSIFAYLNPGIEYAVLGQAVDEDGILWWLVDKTQFTGHEGVISLWVAQADVVPIGDCSQIPQGEIPDVIPDPGDDEPPGGWQPCGSCDSCGQPASECVTSPEGVCLWDPATCQSLDPNPPDDGDACYTVAAAIDMGTCYGSGSAMLDTVPNCQGTQYLPGTPLQAHAVAVDAKCVVQSWTGCGASGSGANVSFVPSGNCTIVAHMGY